MKNLILGLTAAGLFFTSAGALANDHIRLDNTSSESLSVERNQVAVMVSYPGMNISGICDIEITADSYGRRIPISDLQKELIITEAFAPRGESAVEVISEKTLRIPLRQHTYVDGVVITTKDGSTLKETIERTLGPRRTVVVMPRSC